MKTKTQVLKHLLLIFLVVIVASSCVPTNVIPSTDSGDVSGDDDDDSSDTTKEWTFLVYFCGDNSLADYVSTDLQEMMSVGSNSRVNLLALVDLPDMDSKIYYITSSGTASVVKNYGENLDTGDYQSLINFFTYAHGNYPANHYYLTIWNHGSGWKNKAATLQYKGIAYDDDTDNYITTKQLKTAMAAMKTLNDSTNIDVLGMDACLMGMAEVIYEVSDSVDYVVASEETEPVDGWPYDSILTTLTNSPSITPKSIASSTVTSYLNSYSASDQVTLSAIDVSAFESMMLIFNNFAYRLLSIYNSYDTEIEYAISYAKEFYDANSYYYKDLYNFVELIQDNVDDSTIQTYSTSLLSSIETSVVNSGALGVSDANGISIWLPSASIYASYDDDYVELMFCTETYWDEFMANR